MKILHNLFTSSFMTILLLPLAIYYTIVSGFRFYNEHLQFKKTLISNDSFFKALMTLDFTGHRYLPSVFYATLEVDEALSSEDVQHIAQKQIIAVVLKYVKDENLLNILNVYTEIKDGYAFFMIKPATTDTFLRNILDMSISLSIYASCFLAYLFLR